MKEDENRFFFFNKLNECLKQKKIQVKQPVLRKKKKLEPEKYFLGGKLLNVFRKPIFTKCSREPEVEIKS